MLQARQVQASAAGSIQLRIVARLQNQAVATAWESWLQFHHRSKACRAIANRIRNKGLATAFNAWKEWSAQLSRAKQLCKRALGGALRRCFGAWEYVPELLLWWTALGLMQKCNVFVVLLHVHASSVALMAYSTFQRCVNYPRCTRFTLVMSICRPE